MSAACGSATSEDVAALRAEVAQMQATMTQVLQIAEHIKAEVKPYLDTLAKAPLLKMLGIKL